MTTVRRLLLFPLLLLATAAFAGQTPNVAWELDLGPDATFFPSLAVALATLRLDTGGDPRELGDKNGLLGVAVTAPRDGARAEVEISTPALIAPSRITVTLPKKGVRYFVYPFLKYDPERMVLIRQPFAETVTARLAVDGAPCGEKSGRITVRSINDCVYGYEEDGRWNDTSWLFAAYVNENHPAVETILKEALATGKVDSFAGYQGDADDVTDEVEAVWTALARRRIRYSSISDSSAESAAIWSQHVRLLGEALSARQANCVEGACLLASIFTKIGLDASLVMVPGHMFVGVDLDDDGEETLYLETTLLADTASSFEDATDDGAERFAKYASRLKDDPRIRWRDKRPRKKRGKGEDDDLGIIDIRVARDLGILPIREPYADKARFGK
ncbi:hypothetical protein [Desulfolutivibrio sulfoxidireducens]|uniref:hypothetical protein n=1 Tax=Desulfolutivibrio sulfoxidireducens TaxID=2773299 RepID=UPI00159DB8F9|nr:hypothetical protein [Desulfolutivibrio sulfoxidireducens]QLA15103.1 hypothetical protein GD605_02575 [Desulfolutivibrio sulfoxidireducens]